MIGDANTRATALHARIIGPSILMGDGSYFEFENPEATTLTIEDYAYGLAYTARFRGQTRCVHLGGRRAFYSVAQHCEIMARALLADGHGAVVAYAGLMHESGEVVWGDMPGPCKPLLPDFRPLEKRSERAIGARFGVEVPDPALIKFYDWRMLATEKRDLMPASKGDDWSYLENHGPLDVEIIPYSTPDAAAEQFLALYRELEPSARKAAA